MGQRPVIEPARSPRIKARKMMRRVSRNILRDNLEFCDFERYFFAETRKPRFCFYVLVLEGTYISAVTGKREFVI